LVEAWETLRACHKAVSAGRLPRRVRRRDTAGAGGV